MGNISFWWQSFGPFAPEDERQHYPDPGQVLAHFRKLRGWTQARLASHLQVTARRVVEMERQRQGLDSLARRRQLVGLLEIPPALLGLDAQHTSGEPTQPPWWIVEGYPAFEAGDDGYPIAGKVIKHYRHQKRSRRSQERERPWTQEDLGEALNLSTLSVRRMENRNETLDSISRRRQLAALLEIPPALLGLDARPRPQEQHAGVTGATQINASSPWLAIPVAPEIDLLAHYREVARGLLQQDANFNPSPAMPTTFRRWISHLQRLAPLVRSEHRDRVLELEYAYQEMLSDWIFWRHIGDPRVFSSLGRMRLLAQEIRAQEGSCPRLGSELLANMLCSLAVVSSEQGAFEQAITAIEEARQTAQEASIALRSTILLRSGWISLHTAQDQEDRKQALARQDRAGNLLALKETREDSLLEMPDLSEYHIDRAQALLLIQETRAALAELDQAARVTPPHWKVRLAIIDAFRARAALQMGNYDEATALALKALPVAQQQQDRRLIAFLAVVYQELRQSSYGNAPGVARLGWLLGPWKEYRGSPWVYF